MCDAVHLLLWLVLAALIFVPVGVWAIKTMKRSIKKLNEDDNGSGR